MEYRWMVGLWGLSWPWGYAAVSVKARCLPMNREFYNHQIPSPIYTEKFVKFLV